MSLQYTSTGPRLTLTRAGAIPSAKHFQSLSRNSMYISAYRHMYRLRHLTGCNQKTLATYCVVLRRKFSLIDFNVRRAKVLGLGALTEYEMSIRLANTVAFVFNSTCNAQDERKAVNFYADYIRESKPRLELQVLSTILAMDLQTPNDVKYDFNFKWIDKTLDFYAHAAEPELSRKRLNRLHNLGVAPLVGFLQYEQCVMNLNESMQLCL